ncbi:MAG TPA: hypothetical protein VMI31_05380 [Fimbriimonadaceae bacterium]|nr:hypothetical protein [Fimbriimonadaceae bacterium]
MNICEQTEATMTTVPFALTTEMRLSLALSGAVRKSRRSLFWWAFFLALMLAISINTYVTRHHIFGLVATAFAFLCIVGGAAGEWLAIRRRVTNPANPAPKTWYEIDGGELRYFSETGVKIVTPWRQVNCVRPWMSGYILFVGNSPTHIFVRERFRSDQEWERFLKVAFQRPVGSRYR